MREPTPPTNSNNRRKAHRNRRVSDSAARYTPPRPNTGGRGRQPPQATVTWRDDQSTPWLQPAVFGLNGEEVDEQHPPSHGPGSAPARFYGRKDRFFEHRESRSVPESPRGRTSHSEVSWHSDEGAEPATGGAFRFHTPAMAFFAADLSPGGSGDGGGDGEAAAAAGAGALAAMEGVLGHFEEAQGQLMTLYDLETLRVLSREELQARVAQLHRRHLAWGKALGSVRPLFADLLADNRRLRGAARDLADENRFLHDHRAAAAAFAESQRLALAEAAAARAAAAAAEEEHRRLLEEERRGARAELAELRAALAALGERTERRRASREALQADVAARAAAAAADLRVRAEAAEARAREDRAAREAAEAALRGREEGGPAPAAHAGKEEEEEKSAAAAAAAAASSAALAAAERRAAAAGAALELANQRAEKATLEIGRLEGELAAARAAPQPPPLVQQEPQMPPLAQELARARELSGEAEARRRATALRAAGLGRALAAARWAALAARAAAAALRGEAALGRQRMLELLRLFAERRVAARREWKQVNRRRREAEAELSRSQEVVEELRRSLSQASAARAPARDEEEEEEEEEQGGERPVAGGEIPFTPRSIAVGVQGALDRIMDERAVAAAAAAPAPQQAQPRRQQQPPAAPVPAAPPGLAAAGARLGVSTRGARLAGAGPVAAASPPPKLKKPGSFGEALRRRQSTGAVRDRSTGGGSGKATPPAGAPGAAAAAFRDLAVEPLARPLTAEEFRTQVLYPQLDKAAEYVEVAFGPGPLRLLLGSRREALGRLYPDAPRLGPEHRHAPQQVIVIGFTRGPGGELGPAEAHGGVLIGSAVVKVGTKRTRQISIAELLTLLRAQQNAPRRIAFQLPARSERKRWLGLQGMRLQEAHSSDQRSGKELWREVRAVVCGFGVLRAFASAAGKKKRRGRPPARRLSHWSKKVLPNTTEWEACIKIQCAARMYIARKEYDLKMYTEALNIAAHIIQERYFEYKLRKQLKQSKKQMSTASNVSNVSSLKTFGSDLRPPAVDTKAPGGGGGSPPAPQPGGSSPHREEGGGGGSGTPGGGRRRRRRGSAAGPTPRGGGRSPGGGRSSPGGGRSPLLSDGRTPRSTSVNLDDPDGALGQIREDRAHHTEEDFKTSTPPMKLEDLVPTVRLTAKLIDGSKLSGSQRIVPKSPAGRRSTISTPPAVSSRRASLTTAQRRDSISSLYSIRQRRSSVVDFDEMLFGDLSSDSSGSDDSESDFEPDMVPKANPSTKPKDVKTTESMERLAKIEKSRLKKKSKRRSSRGSSGLLHNSEGLLRKQSSGDSLLSTNYGQSMRSIFEISPRESHKELLVPSPKTGQDKSSSGPTKVSLGLPDEEKQRLHNMLTRISEGDAASSSIAMTPLGENSNNAEGFSGGNEASSS